MHSHLNAYDASPINTNGYVDYDTKTAYTQAVLYVIAFQIGGRLQRLQVELLYVRA